MMRRACGSAMASTGQNQQAIAQFDTLLQLEKGAELLIGTMMTLTMMTVVPTTLCFTNASGLFTNFATLTETCAHLILTKINSHFKELFTMRESPRVLIDELGYTTQVVPQMQKPRTSSFTPRRTTFNHLCSVVFLKPSRLTSQHLSSSRASDFFNQRQHRQAGLAILTIAQQLQITGAK